MKKKKVNIQATVRIISTIKGILLLPAETFTHQISILDGIDYPADVIKALCDCELRIAFTDEFLKRMKKLPALRNSIGGMKWSVDVMHLDYEIEDMVTA